MQDNKVMRDMLKFLNKEELKPQLITASLYLAAYEILIYSVVERIKDFYTRGYDGENYVYSEEYKQEVRNLYKQDIVIASSLWFKNLGAITDDDVDSIKSLKQYRNDIAHELPKYLADSDFNIQFSYFRNMEAIHKKISMWWFKEVEVSINPAFDSIDLETLDYEEAISMNVFPMVHLVSIAHSEFNSIPKSQ